MTKSVIRISLALAGIAVALLLFLTIRGRAEYETAKEYCSALHPGMSIAAATSVAAGHGGRLQIYDAENGNARFGRCGCWLKLSPAGVRKVNPATCLD